jgi:NADH-quinone oxidoreductase subunit L
MMMWAPLVVLAFLSIFVGYLGIPEFLAESVGSKNLFAEYLSSIVQVPASVGFWNYTREHHSVTLEWTMMLSATGLGLGSAGLSFYLFRKGPTPFLTNVKNSNAGIHRLLTNKYWVDEIYAKMIINPLHEMANFLWRVVDVQIINGFINFLGKGLMFFSGLMSLQNTGSMQRYAAVFMFGRVGLIFLVIS